MIWNQSWYTVSYIYYVQKINNIGVGYIYTRNDTSHFHHTVYVIIGIFKSLRWLALHMNLCIYRIQISCFQDWYILLVCINIDSKTDTQHCKYRKLKHTWLNIHTMHKTALLQSILRFIRITYWNSTIFNRFLWGDMSISVGRMDDDASCLWNMRGWEGAGRLLLPLGLVGWEWMENRGCPPLLLLSLGQTLLQL